MTQFKNQLSNGVEYHQGVAVLCSDSTLVYDSKNGDFIALTQLIDMYSKPIHLAILSILKNSTYTEWVYETVIMRINNEICNMADADFEMFVAKIIHQEALSFMEEKAFNLNIPELSVLN